MLVTRILFGAPNQTISGMHKLAQWGRGQAVAPQGEGKWFGRITIRKVGETTGCMIVQPESFEELLQLATERLALIKPAVALFAATGDEIVDYDVIMPGETKTVNMQFRIPNSHPTTGGHYIECLFPTRLPETIHNLTDIGNITDGLGYSLFPDKRSSESLRMRDIIKAEATLNAQSAMVRGAIPTIYMYDVIVFDVER